MMRTKLTYFLSGSIAVIVLLLFINATTDNVLSYFPFVKANAKKENIALPVAVTYAVKIPEKIDFAGEDVPLNDLEVRERLDKELTVNAYWQSSTILIMKRANRFLPTIEKILKEEDVPDDFKYLCIAESGLENVVSPAGASGFWQFMKATGTQYGLVINSEVDERYDVEKATRAACQYLKASKASVGSWTAAAAGYNMGVNGVMKQQANQAEQDYYHLLLNTETSRYVQRIIALKIIHQHPNDFGFYLTKDDLYPPLNYTTKTVSGTVDWVNFAKENNTTYKLIRIYNPWIRDAKLYNKERRTYTVKIPA